MSVLAGPILLSHDTTSAIAHEPIETVLARLEAPPPRRSASPLLSSMAAVCSFGLLPLWIWPQRWEAAVEQDRRDLSALAAWWRRVVPNEQATRLDAAAAQLGGGAVVSSFLLTAVAIGGSVLLTWLCWHGVSAEHLLEIGYRQRRIFHLVGNQPRELNLGQMWMALLLVAYGLHYWTMRSHLAAVKQYVWAADAAASAAGLRWPSHRYVFRGFGLMWAMCGVAMCGAGLWWGLPLVMAGARQRQYLRRVRPQLRLDLAKAARAAMGPAPVRFARCSTVGCRAPLPAGARVCPRCGSAG